LFAQALNSGPKLTTTRAKVHVSSMSCGAFELGGDISVFGDTAGVLVEYQVRASILYSDERVLQFAADATAATFYGQALAKFAACGSYSSGSPFGSLTTDIRPSVTKTTVSGDKAFLVLEHVLFCQGIPPYYACPSYISFLYVVAGTNVYSLWEYNVINDLPSVSLMRDLISRVQALYRHR